MAVEEPVSSRFENAPGDSGAAGSRPDSATSGDEAGIAVGGRTLPVPQEIFEAVLVTAAGGEAVDARLEALRDAVRDFAIAEGATADSADLAAGLYIDLVVRGLADPAAGEDLAQRAFNDALQFGTVEGPAPADQLLTALAGGEGVDQAVTRLLETLPGTEGLEGEALAAAQAEFVAALQQSLADGTAPTEAIAAAQSAVTAALADAAAGAEPGDSLAEALASGADAGTAIAEAAARAGLDGDGAGAAIFEGARARALGDGIGTGAAADAAAGQAEAAAAALAVSAVPMSPADQLRLALSAGAGSEGFDAILRQFGLDGASGDAFAEALQRALAEGSDIGEAVASADEAADQAESAEAEQAVELSAADQLAQALADGQQVDQALAAVGGDAIGGDAGGQVFAQALAASLAQGGDMAGAIRSGGEAASAAQNVQASQGVAVSAADQLVAALASGDAADAGLAVASLSNGGGEAFASQLIASLAGGSDAAASVSQARIAGDAAAAAAQAQAVPVSDQTILALAQGSGSQGSGSQGDGAGSGNAGASAGGAGAGGGDDGGLDVIARALAAISPAAGGQSNAGAGGSAADAGTVQVAQGSDGGAATGQGSSGSDGAAGDGVTQSVQAVGGAGTGQAGADTGAGGAAGDGVQSQDSQSQDGQSQDSQGQVSQGQDGQSQDGQGADGTGQDNQGQQTPTQAPASFSPTVTLAGNGSGGIGSGSTANGSTAGQAGAPAGGRAGAGNAGTGPDTGTPTTTTPTTTTPTTTTTTTATTTAANEGTGTAGSGSGGSGSGGTASDDGSGTGGSGGSDTVTGGSGGDDLGPANAAPVPVADAVALAAGGSRSIDVLANDADPDAGDSLSLTALSSPARGTARIAEGRILFDAGSDFRSLASGTSQTVTLSYTVSDRAGATGTGTVTLTVTGVNDAPTAAADAATTDENGVLTHAVLANDSDPDAGDSLSLTDAAIVGGGSGGRGAVSIVGNAIRFDPGSDFDHLGAGEREVVRIAYTASDAGGLQSSAELAVTVTGSNDLPFATADRARAHEDETKIFDVTVNDGDAEDGAAGLRLVSYGFVSGAGSLSHGGSLIYFTPASSYQALDSGDTAEVTIGYTVADSTGATAANTLTILLEGRNDAPVAAGDTATITEDQTLTLDILANDTDVDGSDNTGNFTLLSIDQTAGLGSSGIANGELSYDPGTAYQDLDEGDTATVTIAYTMADDEGAESDAVATLTIRGVNDAPVAVADTGSLSEDGTLTLDVLANDTDVDGDDNATNFVLQSASVSSGTGTVSIVNGQLRYDPGSSYQSLDAGDTATVTVSYVMADDGGATASGTATLTVTGSNDAPVGVANSAAAGEDAVSLTIDVLANDTDVDGDDGPANFTLTSASVAAGQGSVAIVGNQLRFTLGDDFDRLAAGATEDVAISYGFTDDSGAAGSGTLTVTVSGSNDAPTAPQGSALRFDGVNDAVVVADHDDLDFGAGESFTVEAWIRLDTLSGNQAIVDKPASNGSATGYFFYVEDGRLGAYSTPSGHLKAGAASVAAGSWAHVAMVYDGSTLTLYSDGTAVGSAAWTPGGDVNGDLTIGRIIGGNHFDGEMADLRIWNRAVSQGELQHLMRQDTARDHTGLVADYDFSGSGTTLLDAAGSAQSGTIVNGAVWDSLNSFSVSRGEAHRSLLLSSDIDLDPIAANLTYSVTSGPSHGSVSLSGNTYTYTNDGSNNGSDSFQVTVSDGSASVVQTVNVSVNTGNRAPTTPSLKAIRFDGVNDHIQFADHGVFERGAGMVDLTASAWVKLDDVSHVPIFDKPHSANSNATNWRMEVVNGQLRLWNGENGQFNQSSGPTMQTGIWYHVAVAGTDNGTMRMYLDGQLVGTDSNWQFDTEGSGPFYVGRDGNGRYFDGEMAQIQLWEKVLTQGEIQDAMSRKAGDSISRLWAHYNLDGSGTSVGDQGGTVYQNGTLKNGATRVDLTSLQIANDETYRGIVLGDDADADAISQGLSYSIASLPTHGTLSLSGNKFTYDHAGDGQNDSFDIYVSDGTALTRRTITVTVVDNDPPVLAESNSLRFDGSNDFVAIGHHADLSFGAAEAFSLDLWVKPDDIAGNVVLLDKSASTSIDASDFRLELDQGGVRIWSGDGTTTSVLNAANAGIVSGIWNHLTFTYDGSGTGRLYLGGSEIASGSWTPRIAGSGEFWLGKAFDGRFFDGEIGDVRVWSRQVSEAEIQNLMTQEATTDLNGLVLDLDLGGSGTTLSDDAGTAQNGTVSGAQRLSTTAISVARDGSHGGLLLANDAETTPLAGQLNYSVSSGPSNGSVTFDGNRYLYVHDGSNTASDSFTVAISDGALALNQVVNVTVDTNARAPRFDQLNALVFDGTDDYLSVPDSAGWDRSGSDAFTLEAWIKTDAIGTHMTLFDKPVDLSTDASNYRLELLASGVLRLHSSSENVDQTSGAVAAGVWQHVAVTHDGAGNVSFYLNGAGVGSHAGWDYGATTDGEVLIGRDSSATGRYYDGQMAEFRYWTEALTQGQIQAGMTRGAADSDLPLGTRFGFEGSGTTVTDDAGNSAQNGTLVNGPTRTSLLSVEVRNDAVYRGLLLADDGDSAVRSAALSYEVAGKPTHGSLTLDGNRFTYDHVGDGQDDSFSIWVSDGSNRSLKTFAVNTTNAAPALSESQVVNLDGNDDYLTIADHDDLDFTGSDAFSLEMWINPDDVAGTTVLMDKKWGGGINDTNFRLELDDGGLRLYNQNSSGGTANLYADTQTVTAGRWHHIVVAYDGAGTATIYIDGAQAGSGGWANADLSGMELFIGRASDGRHYDGQIAETRIWNKALSLTEIQKLMTQDTASDAANLVLDLDFAGSGATVGDDAGTAQDATLTNGAVRLSTAGVTVTNDGIHHGLLLGSDADIDPLTYGLTYSIGQAPEHGSVTLNGNRFTYDHNGDGSNDSFVVTISDGAANLSHTVNVTVDGTNAAPTLAAMHAIGFDGSDDHISVADHGELDFGATDPITLEAWIRLDDLTGEHNLFEKSDHSGGTNTNYRLYIRDGVLGFYNGNVSPLLETAPGTIAADEWTHVAFTFDGTTARLYKDGSEVASGARQLGASTDTPLLIGRDTTSNSRYFDGQMSEIRVWDRALSAAEIQTGMTRKVDQATANLVLQFDGDTLSGGQVVDGSGNGHDGSLQNGAAAADLKSVQIANNAVYKGLLLGADGQGSAVSAGLSYHLADAPEHGTLTMSGNEYAYDHDGSGNDDSFQVAIDDGGTVSYHDVTFTVA